MQRLRVSPVVARGGRIGLGKNCAVRPPARPAPGRPGPAGGRGGSVAILDSVNYLDPDWREGPLPARSSAGGSPVAASALAQDVNAIRRFNRFYTRQIGVLQEKLL